MPRRSPTGSGGLIFHVFNRAVRNTTLFERPADYGAFERVLKEASGRFNMRLLAYAEMRTHWHLVVWPRRDGELSSYAHWITMTHARRWVMAHSDTGRGAVYQGRFKAIPVQDNRHFLTLVRYVERNPVRGRLVTLAEDWPWSSARQERSPDQPALHPWPFPKPAGWVELLAEEESPRALGIVRGCIKRGMPLGNRPWRIATLNRLGLNPHLGRPGRPPTFGRED